jgi:hypothetical protein
MEIGREGGEVIIDKGLTDEKLFYFPPGFSSPGPLLMGRRF